MDLTGVPTPTINWESSNLPDQWKKFKTHAELIFNGPLKENDKDVKVNYLLLWIGDKGREVKNTWKDPEGDQPAADPKKLDTYYERFKQHVQPKLNPIFARFKFNNTVQGGTSVKNFIISLRMLSVDCQYTNANEMIRDRIVFGTASEKVREKLINEGEKLTLDKAIQIAQSYEYSQEQLKSMGKEINAISGRRRHRQTSRNH